MKGEKKIRPRDPGDHQKARIDGNDYTIHRTTVNDKLQAENPSPIQIKYTHIQICT